MAAIGQAMRLDHGGRIDRDRPLAFTFDGKPYQGFAGDTLASALVASGVRLVGRSFKYHRPRGILSAGGEEPNALVELRAGARREPNTRATMAELYDGLTADSQNRWPSLGCDLLALNGLFSPLFVAGFYYKTFMWPAGLWERLYEPLIRRAAGLGRAAEADDPDHYEKAFAFCDVLVIGSGPAGLAAALAAGRAGARVILAEEDFAFGGRLLAERQEIDGRPAAAWVAATLAELASLPGVRLMPRTTVFGAFDHGTYGALERVADHLPVPPPHVARQRSWRIVARRAVLCAGALERPLVFPGNDRPGVMLAGAVRAYLNRFAAIPGANPVIFTCCDDGWQTARDALALGLRVAAVVDSRPEPPPHLRRGMDARVIAGGRIVAVQGGRAVHGVTVRTAAGARESIACDGVAMAGGWNPVVNLTCHMGGRPAWDAERAAFLPGASPPGMRVAGAAAGDLTLARCLATGAEAGAAAAADLGFTAPAAPAPRAADEPAAAAPLWHVPGKGKAFVDFQNDVTADDVRLAEREGYRSVEHLKRYTTLGMATDQGKTANVNGLAILAESAGRDIAEVGTTMFRPPYSPVAIGAIAGHHRGKNFRPTRLPPSHAWAAERGAVFVETGPWLRAQWYPLPGESDWLESVSREVRATRAGVGVCDVSTLGKIDIQGRDCGVFLDRVYTGMFSTLAVGKARYGLMLREDGIVMDDGTTSRLGPEHYFMTTTTANAGKVMQHLEFCHQVLWPDLDVQMVSVSEQWAQFSLAGPSTRALLQKLVDRQHDLANEAFPFMAARDVTVLGGQPARLFRISFSGEVAYELSIPARHGDALVREIMAAGADFGITPYGTEALGVMRIEKGHVAGNELNGQTTAKDLGLGRMMSARKDFIGRVAAGRAAFHEPDRWGFVGLRPVDPGKRLYAGAHFLPLGAPRSEEHDLGYMTSVAFSPMLGHWIGLGLIARGPARIGERVIAHDPVRSGDIEVEVCHPVHFDPDGGRMHV